MPKKEKSKLKIIPLGGLGEIGKNITVIEYGEDIIIVDCGLAFPDEDMLGVDLVIPDVSYLEVLTAQQTLLSARLSQIADRFEGIQGMINLYQALGGGADEPESPAAEPAKKKSKPERRNAKK